MDLKKGNWNPLGFDLDNFKSDLLSNGAQEQVKPLIQGKKQGAKGGEERKRDQIFVLPQASKMPTVGNQNIRPSPLGSSPSNAKVGLGTPGSALSKAGGGLPKKAPEPSIHNGGGNGNLSARGNNQGSSGDSDLLQSMMKRIAQLEQANSDLRLKIKTKAGKVESLEAENFMLKSQADPEKVRKIKEVQRDKADLEKLVQEMTEFLGDYGLKWIGPDGDPQEDKGTFNYKQLDQEMKFKQPAYRNKLPAEIDTEVLTKRIEELNFIAEKQRIVKNKDGQHHFLQLSEVLIYFYKNGLKIDGAFPFYPYHSKEAQSMLSDILDGYFPYDLKAKYPEGVPLRPVDHTDEMYIIPGIESNKPNPQLKGIPSQKPSV